MYSFTWKIIWNFSFLLKCNFLLCVGSAEYTPNYATTSWKRQAPRTGKEMQQKPTKGERAVSFFQFPAAITPRVAAVRCPSCTQFSVFPPSEFSWPLTFFAHEGCVFFLVFLWSRLLSSLSLLAWFVTQSQRENKPVPVYYTTLAVSLGRGKPVCALSFCSHCAAEWDLPTVVVEEQCGGGMHCVSS